MPFKSPQQEVYLWIHHPDIARRWYEEYGHAKGYKEYLKKIKRKKKKKTSGFFSYFLEKYSMSLD